jgi:hypothetical protein
MTGTRTQDAAANPFGVCNLPGALVAHYLLYFLVMF